MSKINKCVSILGIVLLLICNFSIVFADNDYSIADASNGKLEVIKNAGEYSEALNIYEKELDNYDNLVLVLNDKIIKMEYGIVEFIKTEEKTTRINYDSKYYGESVINPRYGVDGAYLSTKKNGKTVFFMLSGDIGEVDINLVNLIPFEMLKVRTTEYSTSDNKLRHDIKTDLKNDYYTSSTTIDIKPDYLKNDSVYYSYDGHYFYDDFRVMIDDYRNNVSTGAINSEDPYYNYYQYLPHRSYTNYSQKELEDYFTNVLYIDGKIQFYDDLNIDAANDDVNLSQYYDEFESFFGYEKLYGTNAMMLLSLSTHETAYGKSYLAFTKNNLFSHAAFDTEVERTFSRYNNVDSSVYSHAKYYISRNYAGVHTSSYHGSHFGSRISGMNIDYSIDPYWGELAAGVYFKYDNALGLKDRGTYALGIVKDADSLKVYKNEDLTNQSFVLENLHDHSFILLEELENAYKVQVDACYTDDYLYDPETSVGYISKDYIKIIINEDKIYTPNYREVTFDLGDGEVINKNEISIKVKEGCLPCLPKAYKEGYKFIGYDKEITKNDNAYTAVYKKINNLQVVSTFPQEIEYNYCLNLKGGKVKVTYDDKTSEVVNINSNMIESYDNEIEGAYNLIINYCGVKIEYPVTFSKEIVEYREHLDEYINKNIDSYKKDGTYDLEELSYIKKNLKKVDYLTTFDIIRYIDQMLLENTRDDVNYHFKDSKYDVSISGLALSLKDPSPLKIFKPFKDTYYVEVDTISNNSYNKLSNMAKAYDFNIEDSLKVSVSFNLARAKFTNPIIISVKLQDKKTDKTYTVYHLDDDGNIIKCMTTQSKNYVSFMTRTEGDFMVLSLDSVNNYDIEDRYENMSIYNADPDNHSIFMVGGIIIAMGLIGFIMIIIYNLYKKTEYKKWNDCKKLLLEAGLRRVVRPKN